MSYKGFIKTTLLQSQSYIYPTAQWKLTGNTYQVISIKLKTNQNDAFGCTELVNMSQKEVKPGLTFNLQKKMRSICFKEVPKKQLASYTVKLAHATLPANAVNFTCSSLVKRPHTQFTCVTCSLPVKTGKFTCVETASTARRIHANCLQPHVKLPEYNGCFTGNFTCGIHANLPATSMQNCLLLQAKIHATYRQNSRIAGINTHQTQAKVTANAGKNTHTIAGKKL